MKGPQLLLLTLVMVQGAVSGCHSAIQSAQFSEVPDYALGRAKPRKAVADLDILGAKPGVERDAVVKGIRKALGPSTNAYPEPEMQGDAQRLADQALAGTKTTLHLPPDMARDMARSLQEAGLIARLSE